MIKRLLIIIPVVVGLTLVSIFMPARQVTIEGIGRLSFESTVTFSVGSEVAYASPAIAKAGTDTSGTGNALTLSFSHTLVAGANRMVVVSIGIENGDTIDVTSVTYGGQAMTKAVDGIISTSGTPPFYYLCEIWYILEANLPSNGAQTVTITSTGTVYELEINGFCSEYTGVNQGAPEATAEHGQTTGTTITNTISPSNNSWVISTVGCGNVGSFTHGQSQVEVRDFPDASSTFAVAELRGASGQTSLSSTFSGTLNRLERVAASFKEYTAPPDITNAPSDWTLNGITGNGVIQPNTTYYANPGGDTTPPSSTVAAGECRFTLTNSSSIPINLTVTCGGFSGGDANMTNSNNGSNGATSYGAYCWYEGMTYASKVVVRTAGSLPMITNFSGASLKWGAEITTRTNAWTGGTQSTATMTITATAS